LQKKRIKRGKAWEMEWGGVEKAYRGGHSCGYFNAGEREGKND